MLWFKAERLKYGFGSIKEANLDQPLHFKFWVMKMENQAFLHLEIRNLALILDSYV